MNSESETDTEPFDASEYVSQFNVIGTISLDQETELKCDFTSQLLYDAFLKKCQVTLEYSAKEHELLKLYQANVFDFVEDMRNLRQTEIKSILTYLDKENEYLADLVIICWCLPRTDMYRSRQNYNNKYKENISKFNPTLVELVDFFVIRNFCIETITKTNSVPVHCIDLLWYYMNGLSLEFSFTNAENSTYISFTMLEDEFIEFTFNLEYLLDFGLGRVVYKSDPLNKGALKDFLKNFVSNPEYVQMLISGNTSQNYIKQLERIAKDPIRYFDEKVTVLLPQ